MTTTPPLSPDEKRARWFREARKILAVADDCGLPVPTISDKRAIFGIYGAETDVRCLHAAAEDALREALGVTFTEGTKKLGTGDTEWYVLEATLPSGMVLRIEALAEHVADKVTRSRVTEVTEWVRKPAAVPAGTGAAA